MNKHSSECNVESYYEKLYNDSQMDAQRLYPNEEFIRFFSKYLKKNQNKSKLNVIELGCGLCSNLIPLIENIINVYGIDISKECIKLSNDRLNILGLKAILQVSDCLQDNFGFNIKFDAVIDVFSMNCLNTNQFEKLLKNIYNSLNVGGLFYSYFPSKNSQAFTNHHPAKLLDDSTLNGIYRKDSPYYGNFYNFRFMYPYEYKSLLENKGFEVIELNTLTRNYNMKETFEYISITAKKI